MGCETTCLQIVTVATLEEDPSGKGGHLRVLESSCRSCGLDLKVLGLGREWKGFGLKLQLVAEHLKEVPDETLVLFADAYDVVVLADASRIVGTFLSFGFPLVFSAEIACWPLRHLEKSFPPPSPLGLRRLDPRVRHARPPPPLTVPFRFLNSGSYMGYAGAIREAIDELSPRLEDDDQGLFTLYFLAHRDRVALDQEAALFQSLYGVAPDDLILHPGSPPRAYNRHTRSSPCVLHGNGWGMETFHAVVARLAAMGWPGAPAREP